MVQGINSPAAKSVCLDDIIITDDLHRRVAGSPNHEAENEAFHALARQLATQPELLLKAMVRTALRLCRAGTAGVSLLEKPDTGNEIFRWVAVAGAYESYEGGSTPEEFSPCGTCLERKSPQLYSYPAQYFPYLNSVQPCIVEALVIPFGEQRPVLGTIWIVAHDESRQFDNEDVRVMAGLADFTTAALRICWVAKENADVCQALNEADRRKDEFMAMLAHELRNPLAPIRNAVEILRAKGPPVPELELARGVIDRQLQQMSRLIDDLLDISRISRNKLELRREHVELGLVLQGAVETSRPLIEQNGHQLRVVLPKEPIVLSADLARLGQAFSNLLNNAAKFTEPGGHIWLTAERQGSDAVVVVKDSGRGIDLDMLPRIFELYAQVDAAIQRSEGLGIGLALVKRLVEMHEGSIEALSNGPGKGAEFIVRLPIDLTAQVPQRQAADPKQAPVDSNFRILVVDDNRDAADSLSILLEMTGNQSQTAYDGLSAVETARDFQPEIVLLDIGLPKLNGYEVAQRIREQPWGQHMVLIAVTGWGQDDDKQRSKDAGFDHHMVKPVDFAALMKLLAELKLSVVNS